MPACTRCIKAKKTCGGYGMRLSWPRSNDKKRAILGPPPQDEYEGIKIDGVPFVHTTSMDVYMHHKLAKEGWQGTHFSLSASLFESLLTQPTAVSKMYYAAQPVLTSPVRWNPHLLNSSQKHLMEYCWSHYPLSSTNKAHVTS